MIPQKHQPGEWRLLSAPEGESSCYRKHGSKTTISSPPHIAAMTVHTVKNGVWFWRKCVTIVATIRKNRKKKRTFATLATHSASKPHIIFYSAWACEAFTPEGRVVHFLVVAVLRHFSSVIAHKFPTKLPQLMAYQSIIIRCYTDYEGDSWLANDRALRERHRMKNALIGRNWTHHFINSVWQANADSAYAKIISQQTTQKSTGRHRS